MRKRKRNPNELDMEGHTRELRRRAFSVIAVFLPLFAVFLYFGKECMEFVFQTGRDAGYEFISIAPQEVLLQQIKVACILALLCVFPLILFQITGFIVPAFDRKYMGVKMAVVEIVGTGMFAAGAFFSYKILFPFVCSYLYRQGLEMAVQAQVSVEKYVSLFVAIISAIGLVFEMPLVCVVLSRLGLINPTGMKKVRGPAIVVIFIVAALITPPDVISQCIVAIPMIVLYQISIFLCRISIKKEKKNIS